MASIINSPAAAAFWAPTSTTNDGRREYQLRLEPTSSHRILVLGINRDQARKVFTHPQSNEVLELHRRLPPCVAFERYLEPIGYDPVGRPKFRIGLRLDLRQVQIGFVQEQRELDYRRRCPVEVLPDPIRVNLAQTDTEIEVSALSLYCDLQSLMGLAAIDCPRLMRAIRTDRIDHRQSL